MITNDDTGADPSRFPIYEVFKLASRSEVAATIFLMLILLCLVVTLNAVQESAARMTWAFARDHGLVASRYLSRMHHGLDVPIYALAFNYTVVSIIGVLIVASSAGMSSPRLSRLLLETERESVCVFAIDVFTDIYGSSSLQRNRRNYWSAPTSLLRHSGRAPDLAPVELNIIPTGLETISPTALDRSFGKYDSRGLDVYRHGLLPLAHLFPNNRIEHEYVS